MARALKPIKGLFLLPASTQAQIIEKGIRRNETIIIIAGLPRARSARGTEPHTHGIWSTAFRLVVT